MATMGVNGLSVLKHAAHLLAKHGEFDYNMYCVREMEKSPYIVLYINSSLLCICSLKVSVGYKSSKCKTMPLQKESIKEIQDTIR